MRDWRLDQEFGNTEIMHPWLSSLSPMRARSNESMMANEPPQLDGALVVSIDHADFSRRLHGMGQATSPEPQRPQKQTHTHRAKHLGL